MEPIERPVLIERLESLTYDIEQLIFWRDKDLSELHRAFEAALKFAWFIGEEQVEMVKTTKKHYNFAQSSKTQADKKYHYKSAVNNLLVDVGLLVSDARVTLSTRILSATPE